MKPKFVILANKYQQTKTNSKLPYYDRNDRIKQTLLRIIDENGENLGEMSRDNALAIARERMLDLVLLSPNSNPPVARIMEWSKFKYEQSKKKKDNKGKKVEVKEMWFKPKIEPGDIEHKANKIKEFISKGDRVKITVRAQGRVGPQEIKNAMARILEPIKEFSLTDGEPKFEGRNYSVFIKSK